MKLKKRTAAERAEYWEKKAIAYRLRLIAIRDRVNGRFTGPEVMQITLQRVYTEAEEALKL